MYQEKCLPLKSVNKCLTKCNMLHLEFSSPPHMEIMDFELLYDTIYYYYILTDDKIYKDIEKCTAE